MARRALIVTGVVVLVLGVGVVVADQALRTAAEQRVAGPVRRSLGADGTATVRIAEGRPFLLQVASGRLDHVTVTADHLTLDGTDVTDARMDATGVPMRPPYTARDVTVVGTVPTAAIQQRLAAKGLDVAVAPFPTLSSCTSVAWICAILPMASVTLTPLPFLRPRPSRAAMRRSRSRRWPPAQRPARPRPPRLGAGSRASPARPRASSPR